MTTMDTSAHSDENFKEETAQQFREMLLNGEIESALTFRVEENIPDQVVHNHSRDAYEVHKETEEYQVALQIAEKFEFSEGEILVLKAAEWAKTQNLSEVEIHRSATSAYEMFLQKGQTDEALDIFEKYNLRTDELLGTTIAEFNRTLTQGDFYSAAILGKAFNLSASRTLSAAIKACIESLKNHEPDKALKLIDEFKLLTDAVFEELTEKESEDLIVGIAGDFIKPSFEQGKLQLMREFAARIILKDQPFSNGYLKDFLQRFYKLAAENHNTSLENNDVKSARFIRDSFDLYAAPIPYELFAKLVDSAEEYHKSLLSSGDLNIAISFKKDYGLFSQYTIEHSKQTEAEHGALFVVKALEKKQIQPAMSAIQEYKVPKALVNDAVLTSILNLVDSNSFDEAFAVLEEISVDLSEEGDKARVVSAFKSLMKKGNYLNAVEFANRFKLQKSYVFDAASKAWQDDFAAERYDKAFDIKNKYKLDKNVTLALALKAYEQFIADKDYNMAASIRRSYGIHIGLVDWVIEFFRLVFAK